MQIVDIPTLQNMEGNEKLVCGVINLQNKWLINLGLQIKISLLTS